MKMKIVLGAALTVCAVTPVYAMSTTGVLGSYPMTREASGTSWQPDVTTHDGIHGAVGDWSTMVHATLNGVYDWQGGPRGDNLLFMSGMAMASAQRTFADDDVVNVRAMLSPDPLMGKRGYPLLLAAGETADGTTTLVDRQHPHDLFMELSAFYSRPLAEDVSAFIYVGLPGEPAFGPPAFMHRAASVDSPEAPISHHWLDSTHITFGVTTAGVVYKNIKAEVSQFTGREPNRRRTDIDHPRFDSTSTRLSWNPTENISLQTSWAHLRSPEQLHPDDNEERWSASAIYTAPFGQTGQWSVTAAWGRKNLDDGASLDAVLLEAALKPTDVWTIFTRAERIEAAELDLSGPAHGDAEPVGKLAVGVVRDFKVAEHAMIGLGGLYSFNWTSAHLQPSYGGNPNGAMVFVRLKIQ